MFIKKSGGVKEINSVYQKIDGLSKTIYKYKDVINSYSWYNIEPTDGKLIGTSSHAAGDSSAIVFTTKTGIDLTGYNSLIIGLNASCGCGSSSGVKLYGGTNTFSLNNGETIIDVSSFGSFVGFQMVWSHGGSSAGTMNLTVYKIELR